LLKESENPPTSWPEGESINDFAGQWWVAHTKSRNEKALANELVRKDISYFLPLFSGYLFFCGDERQRIELLKTNRVANLIDVKDQQRLLGELLQIEQAVEAGVDLTPHEYIKKGQRCRVLTGSLAGLQGIVIRTKTTARLVLQVDMLGQAASVEIDTDMIEPVE